jgi:hypothetical protein
MRLQCITNTFAIYQQNNSTNCFVYTINGGGALTYASTFTCDYNNTRIVANNNMIVISSVDQSANGTIKQYSYSGGIVNFVITIASYLSQPDYVLFWSPDLFNTSGNNFMYVTGYRNSAGQTFVQCYFYNGSTWSIMTNGNISIIGVNFQTDCMRIIWNSTANLYQVIYYNPSSPTSTFYSWTINPTATPTINSTTPTQTITFSNGSPAGFTSYQFSMMNYDGTTASLPYIHITVPNF